MDRRTTFPSGPALSEAPHFGVIVESRLSGAASGQMMVNVPPTATVDAVIAAFCVERGVRQRATYVLRTPGDVVLENTRTLQSLDIGDGDTLYLTTRGPGDDVFGFSNWGVMAAISMVIGIVGLISVSWIYSNTGDIADGYAIVFDAGSSHTSMFIYRWPGAKLNGTGALQQSHSCTMKGGGIDTYVGRADDLEANLKSCLDDGKSNIPGGKVATTPLLLGATAGMRLLQMKDPKASQEILATVDKTFSASGFKYASGMARIINGSEEGAGAWITSNYLLNMLTQPLHGNTSTFGTLDLGGGSTQYAIESTNPNVRVTLYGRNYNLSTESELCFGFAQADNRRISQLFTNETQTEIRDPCLPMGYNFTQPVAVLFGSPCTDTPLKPNFTANANVTVIGTSNSSECRQQTLMLFDKATCLNTYKYGECFDTQKLGNLSKPFIAISLFYEFMQLFNLSESTPEQLSTAVDDVCSKNWTALTHVYRKDEYQRWPNQTNCFAGQYMFQLLTTGYGFDNSSWSSLSFAESKNNTELGWTLGYAIRVTNGIAPELPAEPIKLIVFVCLIITFLVFLTLGVVFAGHAWRKVHRAPTYQRLSQYGAI